MLHKRFNFLKEIKRDFRKLYLSRTFLFRPEDLLTYRNSIIVFSDGEINEGTKEPNKLIHEVREKIRRNAFDLDDSQNQWVSISTIATGNDVSEAMYLLSKCCSSDAFYHLDVQKSEENDPDLFLPVMLRKTAVGMCPLSWKLLMALLF